MSLEPGTRIGPFEVVALLGAGGMGEVYRARDPRLGREVAVKVLPEDFLEGEERRQRFGREARMLASLNHPGIATLYSFEEIPSSSSSSSPRHLLVMELVEGEGLDQKIVSGPLPLEECLSYAAQIAEALEAAHERGIVHRDLKPANVVVSREGRVKLLDFGLAKAFERDPSSPELSVAPTLTAGATAAGVVLGTAAYMSPEQARGLPLDRRSDVFSFGCLLFECLTGRRAFRGRTTSDTMAAVLTAEPDWPALGANVSPRLTALLRRCLQKDPMRRLRDIGDVRLEIEEIRAESAPVPAGAAAAAGGRTALRARAPLVWGLAGLVAGALLVFAGLRVAGPRGRPGAGVPVRAVLPLPEGVRLRFGFYPTVAVSPDGGTVVFRGTDAGRGRLFRRPLAGGDAEPIPGTEGGWGPFFSPDGEWLGFATLTDVKKVPMSGGAPSRIVEVSPVSHGATWMADGSVVVARSSNNGLYRVASSGGPLELLLPLDASRGEHALLWPQALPGSRGILATAVRGRDFQDMESAEAVVLDPATGKRRVLMEGCTFARYVPPGWLVFVRGGSVYAARLDLSRLKLEGTPVAVHEPFAVGGSAGTASFDVTRDGTLVFVEGSRVAEAVTSVVLLDRTGKAEVLPLAPGEYDDPAFSPDGRRVALQKCVLMSCKLHVFDRDRGVLSPLATEPGRFMTPVWSPDGRQVAFAHLMASDPRLAARAADGSGAIRPLATAGENAEFPNAWSPDGRTLVYAVSYDTDRGELRRRGTSDLWLLPLDGSGPARPWFESPAREGSASISPDGQWAAYVSNETGRFEVYVRPFPEGTTKLKISQDGGLEPTWTRGGREIVYRDRDRFLAAEFRPGAEPSAGAPRALFTAPLLSLGGGRTDAPRTYDVTRGGDEFVAIRSENVQSAEVRLGVVTGWTAALEQAPRK